MLGLLLGAGAFGFGLGAAIRMKRRLGISAEDYARQLQEFRTRHQPPPSGQGPAPYVSCVPSYPDRKAIDDLCKILDAMGRAGSLAEQEVYKDAFRTAWGKLLEGQKRCMEGWIRDSCPRLEATLAQLQAIALPPTGPAPPRDDADACGRARARRRARVHLSVGHDPGAGAHIVRAERHAQTRAGRARRFGGYRGCQDRPAHGHAAGPADRERAHGSCWRRDGVHGDVGARLRPVSSLRALPRLPRTR